MEQILDKKGILALKEEYEQRLKQLKKKYTKAVASVTSPKGYDYTFIAVEARIEELTKVVKDLEELLK